MMFNAEETKLESLSANTLTSETITATMKQNASSYTALEESNLQQAHWFILMREFYLFYMKDKPKQFVMMPLMMSLPVLHAMNYIKMPQF